MKNTVDLPKNRTAFLRYLAVLKTAGRTTWFHMSGLQSVSEIEIKRRRQFAKRCNLSMGNK